MGMNNLWWAYLHSNGSLQIKRYWHDPMDLAEALESPFVQSVTRPFEADSREDALKEAGRLLNGEK